MNSYQFSILLFSIDFIVMLIFIRAANERKKMLRVQEQIKRLTSSSEKENARLNESSQHAVEKVDQRIILAQNAMTQLQQRIDDVQSRSDDLGKLQATLTNYRMVMDQLSRLTEQADARIQEIRGDIEEVEKVRQSIAIFQEETKREKETISSLQNESERAIKTLLSEAKATLDASSRTLSESEASFMKLHDEALGDVERKLEDFSAACEKKMQEIFDRSVGRIDSTFHTMVSTSQVFINELDGRIRSAKEVASTLATGSAEYLESVRKKLDEYAIQLSHDSSFEAVDEGHVRQMEQSVKELQAQADAVHEALDALKEEPEQPEGKSQETEAEQEQEPSFEPIGEEESIPLEDDGEELDDDK